MIKHTEMGAEDEAANTNSPLVTTDPVSAS